MDLSRLYPDEQVPESLARKYMRQLFEVLAYCNDKGICHRDVRLENLLLDNDANLKLTDFGQSGKFSGTWDVFATTLVGSVFSLSPEQVCCRSASTSPITRIISCSDSRRLWQVLHIQSDDLRPETTRCLGAAIPAKRLMCGVPALHCTASSSDCRHSLTKKSRRCS